MNKRIYLTLALLATLCLGIAFWQMYEAAGLESRLSRIDKESQKERLMELSLKRVNAKLDDILSRESYKLGRFPDLRKAEYPMPAAGLASFNLGFFLSTTDDVLVPRGLERFGNLMRQSPVLLDTIRRKAIASNAPLTNLNPEATPRGVSAMPMMGVHIVPSPEALAKPAELTGRPGSFFAWNSGDNLVYMRQVPTTHGYLAEGFLIDPNKLKAELMPLVEPQLSAAQIGFYEKGETPNLANLPLILRPGNKLELPKSAERSKAIKESVFTTWLTAGGSVFIMMVLFALYVRFERKRSDFVSAVSHELRTPLTSFTLSTEMLKNGLVPSNKLARYHENLYRESLRLSHLVENVLAYSRLSRGKQRGRQDVGACGELLPPLFNKIGAHLKKEGFDWNFTLDKRLAHVVLRTDLISLEQILLNLADNAIKYAAQPQAVVKLQVLQTHRDLIIRFCDKGPGIAPDIAHKLFQSFSRSADASTKRKPGIGLGLALSRDLARAIGGELKLEHSSEQGSTFTLSLPIAS